MAKPEKKMVSGFQVVVMAARRSATPIAKRTRRPTLPIFLFTPLTVPLAKRFKMARYANPKMNASVYMTTMISQFRFVIIAQTLPFLRAF